jgi:hypothetical protein
MAANRDSAESSVGNYTRESFLVGERNLLEICAVALRTAQVFAGNEAEFPNGVPDLGIGKWA